MVAEPLSISPSSERARGFAEASARYRTRGPTPLAEPADLLIGVILAHAYEHGGEARVLLEHFGCTARDVVPDDFPSIDPEVLRHHLGGDTVGQSDPFSAVFAAAGQRRRRPDVHVRHLLGELVLFGDTDLRERFARRLAAAGVEHKALAAAYRTWQDSPDAGNGPEAGRSLKAMLEREFPRRPVDVPAYAADRADGMVGTDLIGIRREVDAFAYLLAAKAQQPPLAVGLFGDWGSGKSFFMRAVRDRIDRLGAQIQADAGEKSQFWKHIRQIEFNAWEYVGGTLWASLLDHIFQELAGTNVSLYERRDRELQQAVRAAEARRRKRAKTRERLEQQVKAKREEVEAAKEERAAARRRVGLPSGEELTGALPADAAELAGSAGGWWAQVRRAWRLGGGYWTLPRIALLVLAACVVPGIALALDALDAPGEVSLLGGLAALVPIATELLRTSSDWLRKRFDALEALDAKVEEAELALAALQAEQAAATTAERDAGAESRRRAQARRELTPGRVLGEYITERARSDDYRSHLGLLAQVRNDLRRLERLMRQNNDAPGSVPQPPPNRIILYIDDLDRCPPSKVVEVLEAVHLLLAFELFVVVVAVDSRWLSFSLTDELKALEGDDDSELNAAEGHRATPQDYLEKIFQLPFWVQPLTPGGRRSLVHGLLEPSVAAPPVDASADGRPPPPNLKIGPAEAGQLTAMMARGDADPHSDAHLLALTQEDLRFMDSLAPLLGDTPRRVKRFVNVTQLLLALPPSLRHRPGDREVVAFLAAVNSGLPGLAPALFRAIESKPAGILKTTVSRLDGVPADEQERLVAWLGVHPEWAKRRLSTLDERLDVVRRLSFHREPSLG